MLQNCWSSDIPEIICFRKGNIPPWEPTFHSCLGMFRGYNPLTSLLLTSWDIQVDYSMETHVAFMFRAYFTHILGFKKPSFFTMVLGVQELVGVIVVVPSPIFDKYAPASQSCKYFTKHSG